LVNTTVWIVNRTGNPQGRVSLGLPILSILFYGFGLLVAYKHSETGLRVVCNVFLVFHDTQSICCFHKLLLIDSISSMLFIIF
jgi:hypothetical protein